MKIGGVEISKAYVGSVPVQKVYSGSSLVWELVTLTSFTGSDILAINSAAACATSQTTTRYHDGAGAGPANGDIIYTDSGGGSPFNGANKWWSDTLGGSYLVSNVGVVSSLTPCP